MANIYDQISDYLATHIPQIKSDSNNQLKRKLQTDEPKNNKILVIESPSTTPPSKIKLRIKCTVTDCTSDFNSEKDMLRHIKNVHQKIAIKCPFCDHLGKRRDNLKTHILRAHPEFKEFVSQPKWHTQLSLQTEIKHTIIQNPENRIICEFPGCDLTFNRPRDMKRHVNTAHSHHTSFVCCVCSKVFKRKDYLKKHMDKCNKQISK